MNYNPIIDAHALRKHYSKTLRDDLIHLSAHSHRAWPDIIVEGQMQALELAFEMVDHKWGKVFGDIIPEFQKRVAKRIGTDRHDLIANGENTHELVYRLLSSFPLDSSTRIVTTNAEFYSLRRQLFRLQEASVDVEYVPTGLKSKLTDRIIAAIDSNTDLVAISTVYFNEGYVLQRLEHILNKVREVGATVLLDVYHHFNVRQLHADDLGRDIFLTGAGYKYAGGGEGVAWMKIPEDCRLRPMFTGWFADFAALEAEPYPNPVNYGEGANRFLGATRDISGICRQNAVFQFMDDQGMTVERLEQNNLHQTMYMIDRFDELKLSGLGASLLSSRNDSERGPFLALDLGNAERAHNCHVQLHSRYNVLTDTRGSVIRLGPAPYTTKQELDRGIERSVDVLR